ncbi:unnamed protein product [Symbiodinium natans]|uniref:Uncharacterized protein n=1 Tax=Symbiodinium natans TaxID=878477 RepID=A0A812UWP3_9DINO|nr:unnamed protein product [Symbiodinium natans]
MVGLQIFARPRVPKPGIVNEETGSKRPASSAPSTEVVVRVSVGKWAGDHKAVVLQKGRPPQNQKKLSAAEELQQLQGVWDLAELTSKKTKEKPGADASVAKIYVRGKRVEESLADGRRRFFNLVLAEKARDPTCMEPEGLGDGRLKGTKRKQPDENEEQTMEKRHAKPPLKGPDTLENGGPKNGRKGKGKGKKTKRHAAGHWLLLHHTPKLLILRDGVSAQEPYWWHPEEQASWSRGGDTQESLTIRYVKDEHTEKLSRHAQDPPNTWRTSKGVAVTILAPKKG